MSSVIKSDQLLLRSHSHNQSYAILTSAKGNLFVQLSNVCWMNLAAFLHKSGTVKRH